MTRSTTSQEFTIGSWYVRPSMNVVTSAYRTVQLEPKVMQMLVILAERAGEVISRDALHQQLWPDAIVTDKALTRLASELRKAFGDDARDPQVIATISKNGYRLVAPVTFVSPGDGSLQVSDPRVVPMLTPTLGIQPRSRRVRALWLTGAVAVLAAGVAIGALMTDGSEEYVPALQLTSYAGHEISPALSPAGSEVAFSWQGAAGDNWDVYVTQPGADGLLRLTDHPGDDLHPTWSPDGTQIAFLHYDDAGCVINRVPALSGPVRAVAACEWSDVEDRPWRTSSIDWSPDGRFIAGSGGAVYLLDLETGERSPVSRPPDQVLADMNPVFSPDGRSIAFARLRPAASADLFRISVDGRDEIQLTNEARLILGHAWTRDGLSLLFSSNRSGRFGLWRVGLDGGEPAAVPADGWNIEKVSVARAGHRIVYEAWIYDTNIWLAPIDDGREPKRIISSTLWDRHPTVSPDGSRIAFVSNRTGSWEIWTSGADGMDQAQMTRIGGPLVSVPRWSPDGARIAFQTNDRSSARIAILDVASGAVTPFTGSESDDVAPSWSPSADRIYFGSNRSGSWQIWSQPVLGGAAVQVTRSGGYAAQPSSDGRYLFVARDDTAGLWRLPIGSSVETRILGVPIGSDWGNWALSDEGIIVLTRRDAGTPTALLLFDFDGRPVREVMTLDRAPTPHHPGLSVFPGGRSVLLTLVDATESDLFVMTLGI